MLPELDGKHDNDAVPSPAVSEIVVSSTVTSLFSPHTPSDILSTIAECGSSPASSIDSPSSPDQDEEEEVDQNQEYQR